MTSQRVLLALTLLLAQNLAERCDLVKIGGDLYHRYLMATVAGFATSLAVDPKTEHLFFILHKGNRTRGMHILKHGSLGVTELPVADDLIGQCIFVDSVNDIIYIGTNMGILTYDHTRRVVPADRPIGDDDVKYMFMDRENHMYIGTGPNYEVLKFLNASYAVRRVDRVPGAFSFVLDKSGNVFYEYLDGRLYFFASEYFEPIVYRGFTKDLSFVLTLNNNDEAIVAVKGSLFKLTTTSVLPTKIADLGLRITGLTYLRNDIIVATKGKIFKYKLVDKNEPCVSDELLISQL